MGKIGPEIRRLREAKGWGQAKLAVESGTAVSAISMIENGHRNPNSATLIKLANALDVEVADLFPKAQAPLQLELAERTGRHEHEGLLIFLMKDKAEDGEALEEDLKTSVEGWPLGAVYKFGLDYICRDLLYEEVCRRARPSHALREAKERLDAVNARVSALAEQHMSPGDATQVRSHQLFARRRLETQLQQEEAAEERIDPHSQVKPNVG